MSQQPTHRILIVDDQEAIHEDYRKILGKRPSSLATLSQAASELFGDDDAPTVEWEGFDLDSAFQGQEGLQLVQRSLSEGRRYAMAFVDIRMPPGWDGVETVCRIWEVDPEILIVICSAYSDYSWEEMIGKLGRSDRFLILKKPFDNIEVRQCAMAMTERWCVSRTDVLTGLINRRAFCSHLDLEWQRSVRHELPLSAAMVDLDFFKRINDTHGHSVGDCVIKGVAQLLKSICRASDSVCRYGGEELCVLLPHTGESEAAIWAENARRTIETTPLLVGNRSISITASFGVAERMRERGDCERLIDRADQALLHAKRTGRNRIVRFSDIGTEDVAAQATRTVAGTGRTTPKRLTQGAQAVVQCAANLSSLLSERDDDSLAPMLESVSALQALLQELLENSPDLGPASGQDEANLAPPSNPTPPAT